MTPPRHRSRRTPDGRRRRGPLAWVLGVGAIAGLLWMSFTALSWALADLRHGDVEAQLKAWAADRHVPDATELDQLQSVLATVLSLHAGEPDMLISQGRLYELRARTLKRAERPMALQAAADAYRQAIARMPLYGEAWSRLASVKHRLRERDEEFVLALHRANETGPWVHNVIARLVDTGLGAWRHLEQPEREVVLAAVGRGLKRIPKLVVDSAKRRLKHDVLCENFPEQPHVKRMCKARNKG